MQRLIIVIAVLAVLGGGGYFYFAKIDHAPIAKILKNPRDYEGKQLTIAGVVTDKTSLIVVKYFKVKDETGEIMVITKRSLPEVGNKVRVKGIIQEAFSLGSEQLLVFQESSEGT